VSLFLSGSILDARYIRWDNPAIAEDPIASIENKRIEYAPNQTWRAGLSYKISTLIASVQWSFVDEVYTDATNSEHPSASAQAGRIESYNLLDATIKYEMSEKAFVQAAVNNVLDTRYATRRAGGYPGPGLLPGNGRTITLTLGLNL
jgi:Fe(3+) dicitrate transport protein